MAFLHNFSSSIGNSKSIKLFALGLLFILIGTKTISAQFAGGSGTEADPYQISTPAQLDSVRYFLTSHFELINDIDLSVATGDPSGEFWNDGKGWDPIGGNFQGEFEGNDFEIKSLFIERQSEQFVGLFSNIRNGEVKNLYLTDVELSAISIIGALAGEINNSKLHNIHVDGIVFGVYADGLVGSNEGIGGLVGNSRSSDINNCGVNIKVKGSRNVGSLVGSAALGGDIKSSFGFGDVIGNFFITDSTNSFNTGGLIGEALHGVNIIKCSFEGNISGGSQVGGLLGQHSGTTNSIAIIDSSFVKATISSKGNSVGGLVGFLSSGASLKNSFVFGKVEGEYNVGGLIGYTSESFLSDSLILENNFFDGTVVGLQNIGGIYGRTFDSSSKNGGIPLINTTYTSGIVLGNNTIGSFAGDWDFGEFSSSYFNTEITKLSSGVGNGDSDGLNDLTTLQMLDSTNFTGFDFENTWDIIQGYSFPYLRNVGNHLASVHQITGSEGWRLISAPLDSITYGALLDSLWTQGFTNADYESGTPNVYTRNEASGTWVAISDSADIAPAGEGILVYVYADDDFDGTSDGFPKTLIVQGAQRTSSLTKSLDLILTGSGSSYDDSNDGWNFIGNPFAYPISWDELSGWTKTGLESSIYIWNNTANEYQSWNGSTGTLPNDGVIAPFQGFWVKANNTGTPSITITPDARTTGGALLKKAPVPSLNMTISDGVENSSLSSNSTIAFLDKASVGQDDLDAWKLQPMSSDFLSSFTTTKDGASLDINSLPRDLSETVEIPLDYKLKTNSTIDELSISWELDHFPNDWSFTLLDHETGSLIDMNSNSSYQFGNVINRNEKSKQDDFIPIHRVLVNSDGKQKGIESSRFIIKISPGSALSNGEESELPNRYFLSQNYPNPFNPTTVINFQLPENSRVSLRVFDMLGREVAMLVNGQVEAGYHSVNFDAGNLASGVYIYRLEAGNQIMTRKMTLIK